MRRPLVVLPVLLALVVAGCGGGSDDKPASKIEYGRQLAIASQTLQKTFAQISAQTGTGTTTKQIAQRLDRGAGALGDAADKFAAITPPTVAKADHQKLVDGLNELADVFRKGSAAAKKNDTANLTKALQGLSTSEGVQKVNEAQADLKTKGIEVTRTGK
ncbi:MAG TPA: hypothetical protein VGM33_23410 [Baekduia sp.]|jgi:hypothetical protein